MELLCFNILISVVGILVNFVLAFLLARRPPGLIGRYRPIQSTVIALDVARCILVPLLASNGPFLSSHLACFSLESLLRSALVATVTSESSVMIMGFLYRLLTLKGSRLNSLLSAKWVILIVALTIAQGIAQSFTRSVSEESNLLTTGTSSSFAKDIIIASSYLFEGYEAVKFLVMISIGYRTHRFIRCAIFTKQATRMHRQGLKTVAYQAVTHFIFSFLPLIVLPRGKQSRSREINKLAILVTARFIEHSMVFNGLQTIVNPLIVLWLTPEYRKLARLRKKKEKKITFVAYTVPNYTQGILRDASGRPITLSKKPEESLFSRYCSKV